MEKARDVVILNRAEFEALAKEYANQKDGTNKDEKRHIPATLTVSDILRYYGIGRSKWMRGVKAGLFPQPMEGFERPKRWRRVDVERSLGLNEAA